MKGINDISLSQNLLTPKYILSDNSKDKILSASRENNFSPHFNSNLFLDKSKDIITQVLEEDIKQIIRKFGRSSSNEGVLLIKNCPIGESIPPTPTNTLPVYKEHYISETVLCGMGQLIGEVFGYSNEKNGSLVHNISPTNKGKCKVSSEGAKKDFPFHVENLNLHPYTPSHIILFCIRGDRENKATTFVLNPASVLKELDKETISILYSESFFVGSNDSMGTKNTRKVYLPVLSGPIKNPIVTVEFKDTVPVGEKARKALDRFKEVCNHAVEQKKSFKLVPGDLLIIDNRRVLHSRNSFNPYFDGKDRWLQRCYISSNYLSCRWRNKLDENRYNIVNDLIL